MKGNNRTRSIPLWREGELSFVFIVDWANEFPRKIGVQN
jgi:hypothetical protein